MTDLTLQINGIHIYLHSITSLKVNRDICECILRHVTFPCHLDLDKIADIL